MLCHVQQLMKRVHQHEHLLVLRPIWVDGDLTWGDLATANQESSAMKPRSKDPI